MKRTALIGLTLLVGIAVGVIGTQSERDSSR